MTAGSGVIGAGLQLSPAAAAVVLVPLLCVFAWAVVYTYRRRR